MEDIDDFNEIDVRDKIGTLTYKEVPKDWYGEVYTHTIYRNDYGEWRCRDGGKTICEFTMLGKNWDKLKFPSKIGGVKITKIGAVLHDCDRVEEITFPNSVEYIEGYFGYHQPALKRVNINGNSLKSIGRRAFCFLPSLESVKLPDQGNFTICQNAFLNCGLHSVAFPKDVGILDLAFGLCKHLNQITISDNISIHKDAFYECRNLEEINISPDAKRISVEGDAFRGSPVKTINIYNGEQLCLAAEILQSIKLPSHTKTEGDKSDKTTYFPIKIVDSSGSAFTIEDEDDLKAFVAGYLNLNISKVPPLEDLESHDICNVL